MTRVLTRLKGLPPGQLRSRSRLAGRPDDDRLGRT